MNPIKENIIDVLGLGSLPLEKQEDILIRVGFLIYQNVLMRVMGSMTNEDKDEFEKILDNNGEPSEIFIFLKNKVPNFEKEVKEEAEKLKNEVSKILNN